MSRLEEIKQLLLRYPDLEDIDTLREFRKEMFELYPRLPIPPEYIGLSDYKFTDIPGVKIYPECFTEKHFIYRFLNSPWLYTDYGGDKLWRLIDCPVLNEDIPTIKFFLANGYKEVSPDYVLIVGNIEIIRLLMNMNLLTITRNDVCYFITDYLVKEAETYKKTKKSVLLNMFRRHVEIINWLLTQIELPNEPKPYLGDINDYESMGDAIFQLRDINFHKYYDLLVPVMDSFNYMFKHVKKFSKFYTSERYEYSVLSYFITDVGHFKELYRLKPTPLTGTTYGPLLYDDDAFETSKWVLENAMTPELKQEMERYYHQQPLPNDDIPKVYKTLFNGVWKTVHRAPPHAENDFKRVYYVYLRKNWMKVIFVETPVVMKMLMNQQVSDM